MNRRKKVILVNILRQMDELGNYPPLSTAFLKAYCDKHESINRNYDISLFTSVCHEYNREELLQEIKKSMPCVIGLSCYMWNLESYLEALPDIRNAAKDALIITGGPEAHPGLLELSAEMDAIAIGEGEYILKEILESALNGDTWKNARGIAYRRGGRIVVNPPQEPLANLDDIPSPYKTGILPATPIIHIEYSRGCTNRCSYCVAAKAPYRHMSIERIEEEILFCIENRSNIGLFAGSYLNFKDFGVQTLRLIKKYRDMGHDITISDILTIDSNNDDDEFFGLLDEVVPDKSKFVLGLGIQSLCPAALKLNRRVTKIESVRNIVAKWRFQYFIMIILGLPGDNVFTVARAIAEAAKLDPLYLQMFNLAVIPNTHLFEKKEKFNIDADPMPPHELRSVMELSEKDIKKMRLMAKSLSMEFSPPAPIEK